MKRTPTNLLHPQELHFRKGAARLLEHSPEIFGRLLRNGGSYADLFYECTAHHHLELKQHYSTGGIRTPPVSDKREVLEGAGLRVINGTETGFSAAKHLSRQALFRAADEAADQLQSRSPATFNRSSPSFPESVLLPHDVGDTIGQSEKEILLQSAADAAFSIDEDVVFVQVEYYDRARCILVMTSEGAVVTDGGAMMGIRVSVQIRINGKLVSAYAVSGSASGFGYFFENPPEMTARIAVERARVLASGQSIDYRKVPVVIENGWGGVWLHESVGHLLEADNARSHDIYPKMNTPVATSGVFLVDDGTLPGGRGSSIFDDEGVPSQRTVLIEEGVLRGLLTDRQTAEVNGQSLTGNGRRQDYRHLPLPRMSNLLLLPGNSDPAALIADVKEGIYVKTVGHGITEPGADRFSFEILEGYQIEGGHLTAPITGAKISGSGMEALSKVVGIGQDFRIEQARGICKKNGQIVPVSVGAPTVLISELTVTGSPA